MSEAVDASKPQYLTDPYSIPLAQIDVADPELYEHDALWGFFERLRKEDPVHYISSRDFGPFWSVTKFDDIIYVDKHHEIFSSEPTILLGEQPEDFTFVNFIQSDPPVHDEQRKAVQNVVAPRNLAELEPIIRQRAAAILDDLPAGETFN